MNRLKLSKLSEFLGSSGSEFQTVGPAYNRTPDSRTCRVSESTAMHSETVPVGRSQTAAARSSIRGWNEVISEVARCLPVQTPVHHHTELVPLPRRTITVSSPRN